MQRAGEYVHRQVSRRNRGQTLIIVALLLPLLVMVLALVVDVVNVSIQRQRIVGEAQLAADAGATVASGDVLAILLARHWCQPSIAYSSWDTAACASPNTNGADHSLVTLNQDCPWIFQSQTFSDVAVSDSDVLAQCIGVSHMSSTRWQHSVSVNLNNNGSGTAHDTSSSYLSCDGLCRGSPSDSTDCFGAQVICVEVVVTAIVKAPVVGFLTSASTSLSIQAVADASISLPGACGNLKSLILAPPGDCPIR